MLKYFFILFYFFRDWFELGLTAGQSDTLGKPERLYNHIWKKEKNIFILKNYFSGDILKVHWETSGVNDFNQSETKTTHYF